jgi:cell wall-associated NlpC family hydrolase
VIAALQAILNTGSCWAEVGDDPRTGINCYGLVRYGFGLGGIVLPESGRCADAYFVPAMRPYQPWDMVMADFSGMSHGPRHVGLLLAPTWGFHISQSTNGIAHFNIYHAVWRRVIRHVWRLGAFVCI